MNKIIKDLDIEPEQEITFVPLSDTHVGHVDLDKQYLKDTVAWIKKKGALTVLLGDLIDAINMQDKRFEVTSIAPEFLPHLDNLQTKQVEEFLELIDPIKDQVLGVMTGNHETTIKKRTSYDATAIIASALKKPIMTDPGYLVLRFHNNSTTCNVKIWCSHGRFLGGRFKGNHLNRLLSKQMDFCSDIYLAGHTHGKWTVEDYRVKLSKNLKIENHKMCFSNTGAFLRTYEEGNHDSWASRLTLSPQAPGVVRYDFYLKRKDSVRYIDIHYRG